MKTATKLTEALLREEGSHEVSLSLEHAIDDLETVLGYVEQSFVHQLDQLRMAVTHDVLSRLNGEQITAPASFAFIKHLAVDIAALAKALSPLQNEVRTLLSQAQKAAKLP